MDTIRAGQPLIQIVKLCYQANRPLLLSGRHGVGKSEILEQAAEEIGIGFICRDLSLMEPTDLVGMPKANGQATTFLPPEFLPKIGKGLLTFEELNRCERYMRAPCLQLMTARMLNDYRLPPGWLPVAAINPSDEAYEVSDLDPALLSRFVQVEVIPDRNEWLAWARSSGIHNSVIDYIKSDTTVFDSAESNPRAWVMVSDILHAADGTQALPQTLRSAVLGAVGDERGCAFLATVRTRDLPLTVEQILTSYSQHRNDCQAWIKQGRTDLLKASLYAMLTYIQPKPDFDSIRKRKSEWNALGRFLADLPGDLREEAHAFFRERKYPIPPTPKKGRSKK